jgi:hypothetical protein
MAMSGLGISAIRSIGERWSAMCRGEYDRETLRSVPSWGMSVLLHALMLLLLAFVIQISRTAGRPEQSIQAGIVDTQLGDVTSLVDATRSGDPFTKNDSPDPPSLGLDPGDSDLKLVGQPEIASLAQFAPVMASPLMPSKAKPGTSPISFMNSRVKGPALEGMMGLSGFAESVTAPFSGRDGLTRAKLLRREGGTARSEKSVEDGLAWVARHQRADGSWSLIFQDQCQGEPCPLQPTSTQSDTAATGLALLPLLGAGHVHTVKCRYQDTVRRGLEWLTAHQNGDGDLFVGPPGMAYLYSHAIATMALCEAYGLSQDPSLKESAQRAVNFICGAQDPLGGGWRYFPGQPGDTSVFGWNIFALRSAHLAGLKVPQKVLKGCSKYLDQAALDKHRITYSYQPGRQRGINLDAVMTTEALLSRQLLGWPRDFPALIKGVGMISAHLQESGERNIYYWYYATQLLHNMKGDKWERWNLKIREGLISMQIKDATCAHGSWDPFQPQSDVWARTAGRLYLTSLSLLTLEVYYRYLPIYRSFDEDQARPDRAMKDDGKPDPANKDQDKVEAPAPKNRKPDRTAAKGSK